MRKNLFLSVYKKIFQIFNVHNLHIQCWASVILFSIVAYHGYLSYITHVEVHCMCVVVGGGPRVVVSTAASHARVRGSVPGLGGLKETKMFLPHPRVKVSIVGSLRDREVACSASDRQGSNFESCVWRTVSSQSSHHPQEVLLAQFSLYVHKGGLKPDSFHFICVVVPRPTCGLTASFILIKLVRTACFYRAFTASTPFQSMIA